MNRFGIGQAVTRTEDPRFLTGRGSFVADINLPRQAHGVLVLSPHAQAALKRIDAVRATAMPGVIAVLTGADAAADGLQPMTARVNPEDLGGRKSYRTPRPLLAVDRVRCVGDRVAFVVAETEAQARDAAELDAVEYEPLPAVMDLAEAVGGGAPILWPECPTGNVCMEFQFGDRSATDAAFADAEHVVALRLANQRIAANSLEPRGVIAQYDAAEDSYTIYSSSQNPHGVRSFVAQSVLRIPETKVRVIAPDVGGGFGLKGSPHAEDAIVPWASRRCLRPVKWVPTRSEALLSDNQARDQIIAGEIALDAAGRILGLRARGLHGVGAYAVGTGAVPLLFSLLFLPNVYDVQAIDLETRGVLTNTATITSYRGAGRPEAAYLIERLVERAARVTGIDAIELRRRNFIRPEAMPYRSATGPIFDSDAFERIMERCRELSDWSGFAARREAAQARGRLLGRALSYYIEQGGNFNERMELRFDPGGTVTIVAGTHSHGQGHATTYAQMVSEWLGVPFASIRFVQGDTDKVPFGRGSFAARSSMVGGCALMKAADAILAKAKPMAAALLEAAADDLVFKDGKFEIAGTDRAIALPEVAKAFYRASGITNQLGLGLEASGSYATDPANYPNGCHICEVEIDPETGAATLARYVVVDDVGRAINPLICEGQVHGGLAQGIGQALGEAIVYDPRSGQLLSGSFLDYAMPRAGDFPDFVTAFEEIRCTTNPLGVKGVGEAGAIGAPPTVINAILDALAPLAVEDIVMPATPFRIWQAIARATSAAPLASPRPSR